MTIAFSVMATCIILISSTYFLYILKSQPQAMELEIMKSLANWMVHRGPASKGVLWAMWFLSAVVELIYFLLAFQILGNPVMLYFTAAFAGTEIYHLIKLGISFNRFFSGKTKISQIFIWPAERLSATLFFTHGLLALISIVFFS